MQKSSGKIIIGSTLLLGIMLIESARPAAASPYGSGSYGGCRFGLACSAGTINGSVPLGGSGSSCGTTPPGATAPWLYAATPQSSSAILLSFTDAQSPFNHYSLRYGPYLGHYTFGIDQFGQLGTRTELVSALSPNTTYYFEVRGGNGCAPGPWSNEISATTTRSKESGSLRSQIIKEQTVPKTTKQSASNRGGEVAKGYTVTVKVVDTHGAPLVDAAVTLHSKVQRATTGRDGIVHFTNVAPGQHELLIAYDGRTGKHSLYLAGDQVNTFQFTVEVQVANPLLTPPTLVVVSMLVLISTGLATMLYKTRGQARGSIISSMFHHPGKPLS